MESYPNAFRGEGREDVRRERRATLERRAVFAMCPQLPMTEPEAGTAAARGIRFSELDQEALGKMAQSKAVKCNSAAEGEGECQPGEPGALFSRRCIRGAGMLFSTWQCSEPSAIVDIVHVSSSQASRSLLQTDTSLFLDSTTPRAPHDLPVKNNSNSAALPRVGWLHLVSAEPVGILPRKS